MCGEFDQWLKEVSWSTAAAAAAAAAAGAYTRSR